MESKLVSLRLNFSSDWERRDVVLGVNTEADVWKWFDNHPRLQEVRDITATFNMPRETFERTRR